MKPDFGTEQLLKIYERFGSKAQEALNFVKNNLTAQDSAPAPLDKVECRMRSFHGVYVVYNDGSYEEFNGNNKDKADIAFIGIAYDGHTFGVPLNNDYGSHRLLKKDEYPTDEHCLNEMETLLNWDFVGETEYLDKLGLDFVLREGEYLPTATVFLAMYAHREQLNKALAYAGGQKIDFSAFRWLAARYGINSAWYFYGTYGSLSNNYVINAYQVGAVTLWEP